MAVSDDGGAKVEKPSRSEELVSEEEQERRAAAVRQKLEALLPKRALKPSRSEVDELLSTAPESEARPFSSDPPELLRFQELEASSDKLPLDGPAVIVVEYVDTKYYDDFVPKDVVHYTTGTGFIKLDPPETPPFHLSDDQALPGELIHHGGNPATNEWVPAPQATFPVDSSKPARSESL
jgi:hypothetical protein